MAFTTVPGANGAADSFLGTSGIDIITLNAIARPVFLGARQANDSVSFNSDNAGALNAYSLNGGDGADTFTSLSSTNLNRSRVLGDAGDDTFILTGLVSSTASGSQGNDVVGTAGLVTSSLINGNQGNDALNINAGAATSSIFGGVGDDTITLTTTLTSSAVQANEGTDTITIAAGTSISGSTVNGNEGNDTITVNAITAFTTSTIFGGAGNDTINAAASNVGIVVQADDGNDAVTGGAGTDTQAGGAGNDTLTGGTGNDNLTGGTGADDFVFNSIATNGSDIITDFNVGQGDRLNLDATTVTSLANGVTGTTINLFSFAALANQNTPIGVTTLQNFVIQVANATDINSVSHVVASLNDGGVMDAVDFDNNGVNTLVLSGADNTGIAYVYGYTGNGTAGYVDSEFQLLATVSTNTTTFLTTSFVY